MKNTSRLIFLLLLCLFRLTALAQAPTTLDGWAERLKKFGQTLPQEQVFIHLDNTCYFLGDTIYYKAYLRSSTGTPSRLSKVLYTELLNQDGYLVQRQLIEMKEGQGNGSFVLQDTLYGGYYEMRAYTRWQLNWGECEHPHVKQMQQWFFNRRMENEFFRDYEKLYSRVFPVYDKPMTPGDYDHFMTLRPLRRQFKAENEPLKAEVTLLPEGGHLVAGVSNRVAFEVNDEEGMHLDGTVTLTDEQGTKVAEARTEKRGRGTLEFTPAASGKYTALFTWKSGTAKQVMPVAESDGVALRIEQQGGKVSVTALTAGVCSTTKLGLTIMNQGVMQDFRELGTGSSLTAELDASALKCGVCQATVFDEDGRIYADRLFFVRGEEGGRLTFDGIPTDTAEPFSQMNLTVKGGKAGSTVSLAVRDASNMEYTHDNGNILTEMLLSSQIRGFVEKPGYFFEADDAEHNRALDLLLMIQGWRRYDWHTMATPKAFVLNHMPEQTQRMMGEVNNYTAQDVEDEFTKANEGDLVGGERKPEHFGTVLQKEGTDKSTLQQMQEGSNDNDMSDNATINTYGIESKFAARDRFHAKEAPLKREVLVHASFKRKGTQGVDGEMLTEQGRFSIDSPRFFEQCIMELCASDSVLWPQKDKEKGHYWMASAVNSHGQPNYPEFYVRMNKIFPRFVKPYTWYQCNLAEVPSGSALAPEWMNDGSRTLGTVTVGAKKSRYTKFNASKPAFVVDAYEAFNETVDAGLCPGYFLGHGRFIVDVARTYIGDMNRDREYDIQLRLDSKLTSYQTAREYSKTQTSSNSANAVGIAPMPTESSNISDEDINKFNKLTNIDKVYIYTDYSPRREGDKHYDGDNQPMVTVDLRSYPSQGMRPTYRDRHFILSGFSSPEEFYQPDYSKRPLPETKDYRRTLYWNPDLTLDDNGEANVSFYNNSQRTQISVSAEGMAGDGTLYSGESLPEKR